MSGWIIVAVVVIPLFLWFVLPKMSGFFGDLANIVKAAIRMIPKIIGLVIIISVIVYLFKQCPMLQG